MTTAYDPLGRVSSRTDANGKTTQFGYDNLGRLTTVTDALNQVTSYSYDQVGNRVTQTDANNHATSYIYDARGRRVQRTLPLGQVENYTYDGNGNLQSRKDFNGRTTTYSYDNLNRLLAKTPDVNFNAVPVSYTYTATGRRATMADASGTTTYSYDNRDRLTTKATPQGTLSYTYDAAGDVKTIQSSNAGGANLAYAYDVLNRLATVTDPNGTTNYIYDNVGNLQSVTYPNGVVHSYSYDTRNRLTTLGVAKGATQLAGYSYILDAAGHRLNVTELSGRVVNYSYDDLYRLTNETIAADPSGINGAVNYTYDPVGNRMQLTSSLAPVPAGLWNYDANDRLTTIGEGYDNNGNTTVSGGLGYIYDFENHLLKRSGLTTVYDGDGNRVSKTTGNGTTKYLVDDLNPTGYAQVVEELQNNSVSRRYSWGLELISERQTIGSTLTTSYYVFDGHGSVRALTNSTGAVTDTYDYDAFGNLIHSTGTTQNNYLYSGEQFDSDLNLYYNRARYLNVSTGRFWSMDSFEGRLQAPLSLHKYLYVSDDASDQIDRTGNAGELAETLGSLTISQIIAVTLVVSLAYVCAIQVKLSTGSGCDARDYDRTFYHGTTLLDAQEVVQDQAFNVVRKIARQKDPSILDFGGGLYMTDSLQTAGVFAELQGFDFREGGPAVVRVDISQRNWKLLVLQGAIDTSPITQMEGETQVYVPFYLVPQLDYLKEKYSLRVPPF